MGFTHHEGVSVNNLVVNTLATVPQTPTNPTDAASKAYVDAQVGSGTSGNSNVSSALEKRISLTAAQVKALMGTPQTLIAAPGANKCIKVLGVTVSYVKATTDFTNAGGNLSLLMGASNALVSATNLTAVIVNVGSLAKFLAPSDNITMTANTAVTLSKATNEFAAGDGAVNINITYTVVTL